MQRIVVNLEPDQVVDIVTRRKSANGARPVLINASNKIIRHSYI
jgi:hypothetical protein